MRLSRSLENLKAFLKPGLVYRRRDLAMLSSNVDRHLAALVRDGFLRKLQQGLYVCPQNTVFGEAPPDEDVLLEAFLNDNHFVVYSPNAFNSLGLGTTQLYNRKVVFNRKRSGEFNLGGRTSLFHRWREAPKVVTREFLVVGLLNRLQELAEDRGQVMVRLREKLSTFNNRKLSEAANRYGTYSTQLKIKKLMERRVSVD